MPGLNKRDGLLDIYACQEIGNGESGFRLEGEIRDIMQLSAPDGSLIVVARSNDPLQVFKVLR